MNRICLPDAPGQGSPQGGDDISEGSIAISYRLTLLEPAISRNDSLADRREQAEVYGGNVQISFWLLLLFYNLVLLQYVDFSSKTAYKIR